MSGSPDRTVLRRDRPANYAVLCGVGSGIGLTVAAISLAAPSGNPGRGDPFYWVLMLPVALWAWSAVDFRPWALRLLPVILAGVPLIAATLALALPAPAHADVVTLWIVAALGVVLGLAGWRWRGRSGLAVSGRSA